MSDHLHEIALQRTIHVSLEQLWNTWADANQLSNWFADKAEQDFRVGGRYKNSDGDEGEFLEILHHEKILFTWEQPDYTAGSIVAVHFRSLSDEASELLLQHTRVACDDEVDLQIAWSWTLDSLVSWLERGEQLDYEVWANEMNL